jgi:2-desacetyl-2-hydroxyethyl bacteriochlorophyllide A dehydrogenase
MKAFAIQQERKIQATEIAEPQLSSTDVLIEVHYIGLCGSDLSSYRGLMPFVTLPRIPGHEISGIVLEKGSAVPDTLHIGDRVTVSPYTRCGTCPSCRSGRDNCCQYNQTLGVQRDGALTERIAVPFEKVFTSGVLSATGMALVEPFSVGYHGANRGEVRETDTVLVIGCGTIGMGALCAAVRKGATVIALDVDDSKLTRAKRFGAAYTLNSSTENVQERINAITSHEGVSVVIEAAGSPATFNLALELVCFSGRVVTIGYSKNETGIKTQLIVSKELNIYGSRNALRVFPSVIRMIEQNESLYQEMITKIFPFDQTPEAFAYWDENPGTVSKILIKVK